MTKDEVQEARFRDAMERIARLEALVVASLLQGMVTLITVGVPLWMDSHKH